MTMPITDYLPLNGTSIYASEVKVSERATLTLLRNGGFVLGCPRDAHDMARTEAIEGVKRWLSGENGGVVFPFPVDVSDLR